MGDVSKFIVPNVENFKKALSEIEPGLKLTIDFLVGMTKAAPTGSKPWSTNEFAFWEDIPTCCVWGYCLPCWLPFRNMEVVSNTSCESHCLQAYILNFICLGPCYVAAERARLRKKYDIEGTEVKDFALSCCCSCFLTCQHARELMQQEPSYSVPFSSMRAHHEEKKPSAGGDPKPLPQVPATAPASVEPKAEAPQEKGPAPVPPEMHA